MALRPVFIAYPEMYGEIKARSTSPQTYSGTPAGGPSSAGGGPCWHHVDPRDVATAFRKALELRDVVFEGFFVSANVTLSPKPTLDRLREVLGTLPPIRKPEIYKENPFAPLFDLTHTRERLGFRTSIRRSQYFDGSDFMIPAKSVFLPVDLSNKRVVVTAGGAGIGRVIAEAFLSCGSAVYVCDVDETALSGMLAENPDAHGMVADVSDVTAVEHMFDDVERKVGGVDVLVNNAGIAGPTAGIVDVTPEDLRKTLAVDVEGMFHCARRSVRWMREAGKGSIINLGSVAGRLSFAMRTPYSAAKWGVVGLTKSLALELGPEKIQVNAILPGHVNSSRFRGVAARKQPQSA